ncbi:DNA-binding response regulator, OmpR family, contains REC and winged-helix (wHTH) domain [Formivibrio citricus]|uniref:DNA-binding response regulator, OmpR family, contains REC and winged-helix (WHTH) domain n=1 Tax=Formivibrio citricus TaxID=83765 RepID=A0A1I4V368_9NEIS|nr:response regulator transcription factor [Formivibrio citricus]SFM95638.1 DNA-binding response regulator, OmpR family, contains REC and winged-helix (wHTH) domain [Formivibrio citricus]
MARIILLEDEITLQKELASYLTELGHIVDSVGSIKDFRDVFSPADHLIALVDIGLPDGDGIELIDWLRQSGKRLGIVVISARSSISDKVRGFTLGADHYLSKPFDLLELSATVCALSRRIETGGVSLRWQLDARLCLITPPGRPPVRLTAQGAIVLNSIARGRGDPVKRRQIVEALGEDFLTYDQRRLDTQIHQLRKSVFDAANVELPILTARNRGYIFGADIDIVPS